MLLGAILLFPLSAWSQTPPPAEVVVLTSESIPSPKVAEPAPPPASRQIQVYKSVQRENSR